MTRTTLRHTISAIALSAILGGVAIAQTAPTPPTPPAAPEAPAATAPAAPPAPAVTPPAAPAPAAPAAITAETLPAPLDALNLTDVEIEQGKRGETKIEGELPDGEDIEAMIGPDGVLRHVKMDDDAALPQPVIDALVPQGVRGQAIFADMATISDIHVMPDGVMLGGEDARGEDVRASFAQDGTLVRFGRGDDAEGRGKGGKHGDDHGGKHGKGHGDGRGQGHGPMGGPEGGPMGGRMGEQMGGMPGAFGAMTGMGGEGQPGAGQPGAGQPGAGQRPAPMDDAAATAAATAAGYTGFGAITREGPRTLIEAVNPAGENVTIEISPRGEVVRETAR